ncbi:MAG: hypothetical protein RJB24_429 [Candidatus Parcubacteria bacterium]|jgi:hypothetical protein
MFFGFNLMANRRYNLNNSSRPSGSSNNAGGSTTSSPAPASASSNKASQNSGAPVPGVLLGLSGGWLVARMFFFGGTLWLIEIIAISVAAGFVYPKGGKVQKRFATAIIGIVLLNLFVPGINPGVKQIRETQLNTTEEMYPIVIDKDGVYELPNRPLKVCFTKTGDINESLVHKVLIQDILFSQHEDGCQNLTKTVQGKTVSISLLSGQPYSQEVKDRIGMNDVNNNYEYYKKVGFGHYPIIQGR